MDHTATATGKTILCVASFFKGNNFLDQCKREGWKVVLLTAEGILNKPWVRESIDEVFAIPHFNDRQMIVNVVSYLSKTRDFARIAPLDDYDVEIVAHLREHTRIPGMGETTARYFRDKLAMRTRARDRGIPVPEFVHTLNDERIREFCRTVKAPWLLKPRAEASSVGIKKVHTIDEIWPLLDQLGDKRANYLIERMIPGDVFHVDSITSEKKIVFAEAHGYRTPLLEIVQGGGVFGTRTIARGSDLERGLLEANARIVEQLGFVRGVMHTEFIRGKEDGVIYFLETAARVGGVHISDLVEASTGVDLWREWAKLEISQGETPYTPPTPRRDYGGMIVCLAKQEKPDTSAYTNPEIVWRMKDNPHHVGLIVRAETAERVEALIDELVPRIHRDFTASMPAPPKATA
jgi:hypothetical protein